MRVITEDQHKGLVKWISTQRICDALPIYAEIKELPTLEEYQAQKGGKTSTMPNESIATGAGAESNI